VVLEVDDGPARNLEGERHEHVPPSVLETALAGRRLVGHDQTLRHMLDVVRQPPRADVDAPLYPPNVVGEGNDERVLPLKGGSVVDRRHDVGRLNELLRRQPRQYL
jgi:hypothetical protein